MKFYSSFLCLAVLLVSNACTLRNKSQTVLTQGIEGKVSFKAGNFMPGPGTKPASAAHFVKRKVLIYAVAGPAQAQGNSPLYQKIDTRLVATVQSDPAGVYKCKLAPGTYSVVTQEEGGLLFSGLSNEKGELSPVEVQPGKVTVYNIVINHKAVY